jgi:hypothetical protein
MKIDKNVPLPKRIANRVSIGPLPLKELDVGDSILVECTPDEILCECGSVDSLPLTRDTNSAVPQTRKA